MSPCTQKMSFDLLWNEAENTKGLPELILARLLFTLPSPNIWTRRMWNGSVKYSTRRVGDDSISITTWAQWYNSFNLESDLSQAGRSRVYMKFKRASIGKNMFRIMDPQPGHAIHHAALPHAGQIPICVWNRTAWEAFLRASWLLGLRLDPMVNDDGNPSGNASIASDTWHSHTVWCCLQSEVLCVTALARRAYPTILRLASFADAPTHLLGMSTE